MKRTKTIMSVPVGDAMIGRVVNPLGQPLDGKGPDQYTGTNSAGKSGTGRCGSSTGARTFANWN